MPNYVNNILKISCDDDKILEKIKALMFTIDSEGELNYTMEKLLPMPKEFSDIEGYNDYGYNWCCVMWGTKWDVCDPEVLLSGNTIRIHYETAWSPNTEWVESLCKYIKWMLYAIDDQPTIELVHEYSEIGMNFGGILEWSPDKKFKYHEYSLMEYAYLYHKDFHDSMVECLGFEPFNPVEKRFYELYNKVTGYSISYRDLSAYS